MNLNFPHREAIAIRDHEIKVARRLSGGGEVKVREGARVTADSIIAQINPIRLATVVPVSVPLGVPAAEADKLLLKQPGAEVAAGEIIAKTRRGLRNLSATSPISGVFLSYDVLTGNAAIAPAQAGEIHALVPGDVDQIVGDEKVVIRTVGSRILGIVGLGGITSGPLKVVVEWPDAPLDASKIGPHLEGAIVVGGSFADAQALRRLVEVRARGLIVGGLLDRDVQAIIGKSSDDRCDLWRLTPSERVIGEQTSLPLAIMATEGFGRLPINPESFLLLKELEQQHAVLSADTKLGGELIRPELVVANEEAMEYDAMRSFASFAEGSHVRLVDHAMLGLTGIIVSVPRRIRRADGQPIDLIDVQIHGAGVRPVSIPNLEIVA
ncbi:MAG: hypothetical protein ACJ789_01700 [Thermomicrobiales bacterium]